MDVLASNDGRLPHEKSERIRSLRPDMILLSAERTEAPSRTCGDGRIISRPPSRARASGLTYSLPLIYAGNTNARDRVTEIRGKKNGAGRDRQNLPTLERNLAPPAIKSTTFSLEHVMAQAPGTRN